MTPSPLSPESVAQMVADLMHTDGPDSEMSMLYRGVIADAITTLSAENATLRAERDEGLRLLDNARQIERNVQSVREHEHKRAEAALAELAALRASEAAAMERVKVLTDLMQWSYDTLGEINTSNYDHDDVCSLNNKSIEVILALHRALTPTADKEPKT